MITLNSMPYSTSDLIKAIRERDVQRCRELIKAGVNPSEESASKRTFLHLAAEEGDAAVVAVLLDAGALVNARTKELETPLHFAARYGRGNPLDLLLLDQEFMQDNPWERRNKKPIGIETARRILDVLRRHNPEIPAELGLTDEIPADIKWDVFTGIFELMTDRPKLLQELQESGIILESLDPEFVEQLRGFPRYLSAASLLIKRGADVNAFNEFGETPLHLAIQYGEVEMTELLLNRGADPNARLDSQSRTGNTPMRTAIEYYQTKIAELLHSAGGRIEFENDCPLHTAAANGQVKLLDWLLASGGNINQRDIRGDTPLMSAARSGHDDVVKFLCGKGADLIVKNERGEAAVHLAASWNKCLRPLLEQNIETNLKDADGQTPLHHAAMAIDPDSVRLLVDCGSNLNATNQNGNTPLHSIFFGDEFRPDIEFSTFEALVKAGADRTIQNHKGQTAFDLALTNHYPQQYLDLLKPD